MVEDRHWQELTAKGWAGVGEVFDLLDELRENGFRFGISEYLTVQTLLFKLHDRGVDLAQPDLLRKVLPPVLCSSPLEQESFLRLFDAWSARHVARQEPEDADTASPDGAVADRAGAQRATGQGSQPKATAARRTFRWKREAIFVVVVLVVLVISAAIYINWPSEPSTTVNQGAVAGQQQPVGGGGQVVVAEPQDWRMLGGCFLTLILLGVGGFLYRLRRERRRSQIYLQKREGVSATGLVRRLTLKADGELMFPPAQFARVVQRMRRRITVGTGGLDVNAMVMDAAKNSGRMRAIYRHRTAVPEYVVLLDCADDADASARLYLELVRTLRKADLAVTTYVFDGDPRICHALERDSGPVRLWDLLARHGEERLILFTEGRGLFDGMTGCLAGWTSIFEGWSVRALLTARARENWGAMEREFLPPFQVLEEATPAGIDALSRALIDEEADPRPPEDGRRPIPEDLITHSRLWTGPVEPAPAWVRRTLHDLRQALGEEGYLWLQACAVYPVLDWQLTLSLGTALRDSRGASLRTPRRLADLAALPWFRHNRLPNWMRRWLVYDLTPAQDAQVREVLNDLLDGGGGEEDADPGASLPHELSAKPPREASGEDGDGTLRDVLFLSVMAEHSLDRVAFRVSRSMEEKLRHVGGWLQRLRYRWSVAKGAEKGMESEDGMESVKVSPYRYTAANYMVAALLMVASFWSSVASSSVGDGTDLTEPVLLWPGILFGVCILHAFWPRIREFSPWRRYLGCIAFMVLTKWAFLGAVYTTLMLPSLITAIGFGHEGNMEFVVWGVGFAIGGGLGITVLAASLRVLFGFVPTSGKASLSGILTGCLLSFWHLLLGAAYVLDTPFKLILLYGPWQLGGLIALKRVFDTRPAKKSKFSLTRRGFALAIVLVLLPLGSFITGSYVIRKAGRSDPMSSLQNWLNRYRKNPSHESGSSATEDTGKPADSPNAPASGSSLSVEAVSRVKVEGSKEAAKAVEVTPEMLQKFDKQGAKGEVEGGDELAVPSSGRVRNRPPTAIPDQATPAADGARSVPIPSRPAEGTSGVSRRTSKD